MQTFAFYVEDDRYTVPTLKLETFGSEEEALQRARIILDGLPHYHGIEVCLDGKRLFGIGSCCDAQGR